MPTLIALNTSLSMARILTHTATSTYASLATHLINSLVENIKKRCRLEFIGMGYYASSFTRVFPFSRETEDIRAKLKEIEPWDTVNFIACLSGCLECFNEFTENSSENTVILMTDRVGNYRRNDLANGLEKFSGLPFKLLIVQLSSTADKMLDSMISLGSTGSELFLLSELSKPAADNLADKLCSKHYKASLSTLNLGGQSCMVQLYPTLQINTESSTDSEQLTLQGCGFLNFTDLACAPCVSRHLVMPNETGSGIEFYAICGIQCDMSIGTLHGNVSAADSSRVPYLTVLLHGALKDDNDSLKVALVRICPESSSLSSFESSQFGMIYPSSFNYVDHSVKKKSNLILGVFPKEGVPWLGDFSNLKPVSMFNQNPYVSLQPKGPFPLSCHGKRSYSVPSTIWIKNSSVQSDIQKIVRLARKLPDRQGQLFKEVNRIRKTALTLDLPELLIAVAEAIETECVAIIAHSETLSGKQLRHVIACLKGTLQLDPMQNLLPIS